ncbi:MAG: hypothetical protein ACI8UO_003920 [Verrucomicrobiales bacterium]|jgi:hypothetical protein
MLSRWLIFLSAAYTLLIPWCGGSGICGEWAHDILHVGQVQNHDHNGGEDDHEDQDSHRALDIFAPEQFSFPAADDSVIANLELPRPNANHLADGAAVGFVSKSDFRAPPPTLAALCVFLT